MGAAVEAAEVQIRTDIDGMHNNDPRFFVDNTRPIRTMEFERGGRAGLFRRENPAPGYDSALQGSRDSRAA